MRRVDVLHLSINYVIPTWIHVRLSQPNALRVNANPCQTDLCWNSSL